MRSWKVIPWKVDLEGTTITGMYVCVCMQDAPVYRISNAIAKENQW